MRKQKDITPPRGSRRGCLCWDKNTYSRKCCGDGYRAQGIGKIYKDPEE